MDIEQLKLILDAVSNASGDAKEVVVWYLIATAIPTLVSYLLTFTAVISLIVVVRRIVMSVVYSGDAANDIARMVGRPIIGYWTYEEKKSVMRRIEELLNKERMTQSQET